MSDTVEKIYCTDTGNNDALTAAALMRQNDSPLAAMAAMGSNGFGNNWMNNPFAYLMFMPMMYGMVNGNGWGNNRGWGNGPGGYVNSALDGANTALNATTQANVANLGTQVQNLGNQMQDNHNMDQLNDSVGQVQGAIRDLSGVTVGGFANLAQDLNGMNMNMQNNCCDIKTAIQEQGAEARLATCQQTNTILQQSQALQNTAQNGFTQLGFQIERNACDVKETSTANTQKIVDTLNNHWNLEQQTTIQQLRDEVGRLNQTNAILAAINGGNAAKTVTT